MRKNINILNRERCTGCRVCENVCPSQAIEFKENKEGFLYPNVKEDLCTNCGFCTQKCPVLTETEYGEIQECYAVMSEKDIRMESSSGGMFTVLANYILKKGGYVCGAAWKSPFTVAHKIIHRNEDLHELQLSKYIQSDLNDCYRQIKDLLAENKAVLFVGCPCQVDGLYHFLGKRDNQSLITADLVCHGVPSYKTLEKYCKEVAGDRRVKKINFRSKEVYKWSTTMKIEFSDGSIYRRGFKEDPWFNCFAENLFFRSSCYACKYAKIPRVGDFTLGDFWQIWRVNPSLDDGWGTSLVLANTEIADKLLAKLKKNLTLLKKMPLETARRYNAQLNYPSPYHKKRETFYKILNEQSFKKAMGVCLKGKADVGILGYWYATNYGSVITYYALYKIIENLGYTAMLIDRPDKEKDAEPLTVFSREFLNKYCNISISPKWKDLEQINDLCDSFIVGSDQVWTRDAIRLMGYYFFLSFITDDKKKIAYSCSFGQDKFEALPNTIRRVKYYLKKFDAISVRENSGVKILRETLGVDGQQVLDPIFLLPSSEYEKIATKAQQFEQGNYILSYILDPNEAKKQALLFVSKKVKLKLVNLLDGRYNTYEKNKAIMNLENTKCNVMMEDWVNYFMNADFVVTDSHHGLAMAIIFNKPFICINNPARGGTRFTSLLSMLNLEERLITPDQIMADHLYEPIEYNRVNEILDEKREQALNWLKSALKSEKQKMPSGYDILMEEIRKLSKRIDEISQKQKG